jgi:hypothetical protein
MVFKISSKRILSGMMALVVMSLVFLPSACGNNRKFDSTAWLQNDARTRGRMSQDLVDSKLLIGKTVEEAKRVLGQPDYSYPTALQYHIDLGWAFKDPKHYGLQVHFDEKRLVREVKIVD